jgi:hypothetical protein
MGPSSADPEPLRASAARAMEHDAGVGERTPRRPGGQPLTASPAAAAPPAQACDARHCAREINAQQGDPRLPATPPPEDALWLQDIEAQLTSLVRTRPVALAAHSLSFSPRWKRRRCGRAPPAVTPPGRRPLRRCQPARPSRSASMRYALSRPCQRRSSWPQPKLLARGGGLLRPEPPAAGSASGV